LTLSGRIITDKLGCQPDQGPGRGFPGSTSCVSGGGAYGGDGGLPLASPSMIRQTHNTIESARRLQLNEKSCSELAAQPYGMFDSARVQEGSGGGTINGEGQSVGNNGGGIIWLQAQQFYFTGLLSSNGGTA